MAILSSNLRFRSFSANYIYVRFYTILLIKEPFPFPMSIPWQNPSLAIFGVLGGAHLRSYRLSPTQLCKHGEN